MTTASNLAPDRRRRARRPRRAAWRVACRARPRTPADRGCRRAARRPAGARRDRARDRASARAAAVRRAPWARPGVARRTASGCARRRRSVISGSSSGIGGPNSGSSRGVPAGVPAMPAPVPGAPKMRSRSGPASDMRTDGALCHRRVDERQVVERVHRLRVAAERQLGTDGDAGDGQREVVSTVAAAVDVLEPEVAALGTLHGTRRTAFSSSGGAGAGSVVSASSCRWMSARSRSASAFWGRSAESTRASASASCRCRSAASARARPSAVSPRRGSGSADSRATGAATVGGGRGHASGASRQGPRASASRSDRCDAAKTASATIAAPSTRNAMRPPIDRDDRPAGTRRFGAMPRGPSGPRPPAPPRFEPVQPIEHGERLFRAARRCRSRPAAAGGFVAVAAAERGDAVLQQLFGLALPLGQRAARALDVGARARVAAVEEQRARPDVDGVLVVGGEVVIEADEQQLLDLRVAIRCRLGVVSRVSRRCEADRT